MENVFEEIEGIKQLLKVDEMEVFITNLPKVSNLRLHNHSFCIPRDGPMSRSDAGSNLKLE